MSAAQTVGEGLRLRLNLGSADWEIPDFQSVDLPSVDLSVFPWPWETESVDEIYAGHILEHFDRSVGIRFLGECRRILKPGGRLSIAVPDMDLFIDCYLSGDFSPLDGYHWRDLNHLLGGDAGEMRPEWRHKYMYCQASLCWELWLIGFRQFGRVEFRDGLDNPKYRAISLYVEAVK